MGDSRPGLALWLRREAANKIAIRLRRREAENKDHQNLDDGRYREGRNPAADVGIIGAPESKRGKRPGDDQQISSAEHGHAIPIAADRLQSAMRKEIGPYIAVAQGAGSKRDQILAQEYDDRPGGIGRAPNSSFECEGRDHDQTSRRSRIESVEASLGVRANMPQDTGIVLAHDPLRYRQPIRNGIKPELVRGALDNVGAAVRTRNKLETRGERAEVADDMRSMHVLVGAELAHSRYVAHDLESELSVRLPFRHALDRGPGRELAIAHGADAFADHLASQRIGDTETKRQRQGPFDRVAGKN